MIVGTIGQQECPDWAPLLAFVGESSAGEFMWMSQVDLADGGVMHAYKHIVTRRYLHLAGDGRTLVLVRPGRYRVIGA